MGDDLLELVRRGDVSSASFEFSVVRPGGDTFERRSDRQMIRTIRDNGDPGHQHRHESGLPRDAGRGVLAYAGFRAAGPVDRLAADAAYCARSVDHGRGHEQARER
jgi:hypothetical protein